MPKAATSITINSDLSGGRFGVDPRIAELFLAQIRCLAADNDRDCERAARQRDKLVKSLPPVQRGYASLIGDVVSRMSAEA